MGSACACSFYPSAFLRFCQSKFLLELLYNFCTVICTDNPRSCTSTKLYVLFHPSSSRLFCYIPLTMDILLSEGGRPLVRKAFCLSCIMQDYQVNCCHLHCRHCVLITPAESYDGFIPSEVSDVAILTWSKSKTPKSILP